jgi:hypothetical protein
MAGSHFHQMPNWPFFRETCQPATPKDVNVVPAAKSNVAFTLYVLIEYFRWRYFVIFLILLMLDVTLLMSF